MVNKTTTEDSVLGITRDIRPRKDGWAPGHYYNICIECQKKFVGDKRAVVCADCVYKPTEEKDAKTKNSRGLGV